MSEVEKLYRNCGINKSCQKFCVNDFSMCNRHPDDCDHYTYPPFTAEKQLELIKLIANRKGYPDYEYFGTLFDDYIQLLDFDEAISKCINDMWDIITPNEKQLIKEVLQ